MATGRKLAAEACKRIARIDEEILSTHASSLAKEWDLFAIKEKDDGTVELHCGQAPREPLCLCYGCISGLPPSQLQPLQMGETVIWSVDHLVQDWKAEQANPSTCSQSVPSCHTTRQIQHTT